MPTNRVDFQGFSSLRIHSIGQCSHNFQRFLSFHGRTSLVESSPERLPSVVTGEHAVLEAAQIGKFWTAAQRLQASLKNVTYGTPEGMP
jgi:hypothetical protein